MSSDDAVYNRRPHIVTLFSSEIVGLPYTSVDYKSVDKRCETQVGCKSKLGSEGSEDLNEASMRGHDKVVLLILSWYACLCPLL
jgi:hypothetical protein